MVDFQNSYCNSPKYEKDNYIAKKLRKEIYLCNQNDIYLNETIKEFYQNILKKIYPSQTLSFYDTMLKISESWNKIGCSSEDVEETLSQINKCLTDLNGHN